MSCELNLQATPTISVLDGFVGGAGTGLSLASTVCANSSNLRFKILLIFCFLILSIQFQVASQKTAITVEDLAQDVIPMAGLSYYLPRYLNGVFRMSQEIFVLKESLYIFRLRTGAGVGTWLALSGAVIDDVDTVHSGLASHYIHDAGKRCLFSEF